jgi:hypothetical protein
MYSFVILVVPKELAELVAKLTRHGPEPALLPERTK